jgi:hypothetical protein
VCFWQVELFPKNGLLILEMYLVHEVLCQTQVIFTHDYCRLVFEQGVDVPAPVWFWCSKVALVFNFFSGPRSLLDFW